MKTRRFCPHCGRPLLKSHNDKHYNKYSFQCYGCEEDFFKFEVLRKKDMEDIIQLRLGTINRECREDSHLYSVYKPYPQRN
jgi:hypothetical protein